MEIKSSATISGLHPVMRAALIAAERVWRDLGRSEGVTVTSGLDGVHSAESLHYYGLALDFRTRYFSNEQRRQAASALRATLGRDYDVVVERTHIHVEPAAHAVAELFSLMGARRE